MPATLHLVKFAKRRPTWTSPWVMAGCALALLDVLDVTRHQCRIMPIDIPGQKDYVRSCEIKISWRTRKFGWTGLEENYFYSVSWYCRLSSGRTDSLRSGCPTGRCSVESSWSCLLRRSLLGHFIQFRERRLERQFPVVRPRLHELRFSGLEFRRPPNDPQHQSAKSSSVVYGLSKRTMVMGSGWNTFQYLGGLGRFTRFTNRLAGQHERTWSRRGDIQRIPERSSAIGTRKHVRG
jgi:hypothetical protein